MFAQIALLSPPYSCLEYALPSWFPAQLARPGLRVAVPLGKNGQLRCGYILKIAPVSSLQDSSRVKEILWPLEKEPVLNEDLLALAAFLAKRQALEPGVVFGHSLPAGLRTSQVKFSCQDGNARKIIKLQELANFSDTQKSVLVQDFIEGKLEIVSGFREEENCYDLLVDPPWPVRPGAKKQIAILDCLLEKGCLTRKQLVKIFGSSCGASLQELQRKNLVKIVKSSYEKSGNIICKTSPGLNEEQLQALSELKADLDHPSVKCRLLHGITGSGKTAVYLALAKYCLDQGKSVFLLAPEVALAIRLFEAVSQELVDFESCLFHGYQTATQREKIFLELAQKDRPSIVVGTRSALFLPLKNPGLIILDEEHDGSFKQDEGFPYHCREAAWQRCQHNGALLLLGSATPDIRTYQAASSGVIGLSRISRRAGEGSVPETRLITIDSLNTSIAGSLGNSSLLSKDCEKALSECANRGEQAIILLNRRGYSPLMYCPSCAKTMACPHCEIALTYHKNLNRLVCHYCGYYRPYPSPCPDCGRINLLPLGEGTEKLEEKLETIACQPVLRMDRDKVRRKGSMEEIMGEFARGGSPFMVGTQMISKGHHFPNVTLVVIADGDMGLNMPDYRAAERSFQLLVQTAGRAGRGGKKGQVLIQTRNPSHYCWKFVQNYDYTGFYEQELARRRKFLYPPFTNLALLRLSSNAEKEEILHALHKISLKLRDFADKNKLRLLGPAPAPISFLRGMHRHQFLIKGKNWESMRLLYLEALKVPESRIFKVFLDMDPVNMM